MRESASATSLRYASKPIAAAAIALLFVTLPFAAMPGTAWHLPPGETGPTGDCSHESRGQPWYELAPSKDSGSCTWHVRNPAIYSNGDVHDIYWYVFRGWDLEITVDVHGDAGQIRVERAAHPTYKAKEPYEVWWGVGTTESIRNSVTPVLVESASTSTFLSLTKPVIPLKNQQDNYTLERVRFVYDAGAAGPHRIDFTVTFSRSLPVGAGVDCVGFDTTPSNRGLLTPGQLCAGRFVDALRGSPRHEDGYLLDAHVTDGDVLTWSFSGTGHSIGILPRLLAASASADTAIATTGEDSIVQPASSSTGRYVANGEGQFGLDLRFWYAFATLTCWPGGTCYANDYYDDASTGPFDYSLSIHHRPNARPAYTLNALPTVVFDGDVVEFGMTVTDPDGNTVRPVFETRIDGVTQKRATTPASGPSGTTFRASIDTRGLADATWGTSIDAYWNALDHHDVPAHVTNTQQRIDVYPSDCGMRGDAPPAGRLFSGTCQGWVSTFADSADLLLHHVGEGAQRVIFDVLGNVEVEIEDPTGVTRVVELAPPPAGGLPVGTYHDYLEKPGEYRIRISPLGAFSPYTVAARSHSVPEPDGELRVSAVHTTRLGEAQEATGSTLAHGFEKIFRIHEDSLENASGAIVRMHARHTESWTCSGVRHALSVNGIFVREIDARTQIGTTARWVAFDIPVELLHAGENRVRLRHLQDEWACRVAMSYDSHQWYRNSFHLGPTYQNGQGSEYLMLLDLAAAAGPARPVGAGFPSGFLVHAEEPDTYPARVLLDPGDGAGYQEIVVPYGEAVHFPYTYAHAGAVTVDAVAQSMAPDGFYFAGASFTIDVVDADDCGSGRDATLDGVYFMHACEGIVGGADPVDVLQFDAAAGHHVRIEVDGAVRGTLVSPDGITIPVVSGEVNDHVRVEGIHRLALESLSGSPEAYALTVARAPAPPPTGRIAVEHGPFTGIGNATRLNLAASDLHHQGISYTVHWGDGTTMIVPEIGHLAYGDHEVEISHAYAQPGDYEVLVHAIALDGRSLDPASAIVRVATPNDCGAGDAPDGFVDDSDPSTVLLSKAQPLPAQERCYGSLGPQDPRDHYEYILEGRDLWKIIVRPEPGARISADAFLSAGTLGFGAGWDGMLAHKTEHPDGSIEFRPTVFSLAGKIMLRIMEAGTPGNYEIETVRERLA